MFGRTHQCLNIGCKHLSHTGNIFGLIMKTGIIGVRNFEVFRSAFSLGDTFFEIKYVLSYFFYLIKGYVAKRADMAT